MGRSWALGDAGRLLHLGGSNGHAGSSLGSREKRQSLVTLTSRQPLRSNESFLDKMVTAVL